MGRACGRARARQEGRREQTSALVGLVGLQCDRIRGVRLCVPSFLRCLLQAVDVPSVSLSLLQAVDVPRTLSHLMSLVRLASLRERSRPWRLLAVVSYRTQVRKLWAYMVGEEG